MNKYKLCPDCGNGIFFKKARNYYWCVNCSRVVLPDDILIEVEE